MATALNNRGTAMTEAQKRTFINRMNRSFGFNVKNMGQADAALQGLNRRTDLNGRQRRTLESLNSAYGGSQ